MEVMKGDSLDSGSYGPHLNADPISFDAWLFYRS